jgi:preprotein translocase subunit SecA
MTGTAVPAANELREFYGLTVVVIPTNKPCIRVDHPDVIFTHKAAKYKAVVSEVIRVNKTGRPVLIGTCSVEESELLAERLRQAGVGCNVLNAKNDELEAGIIAMAGEAGAVTVSTNMAGRGTDIKLGGPQEKGRNRVVELGGLYVIGTNRHESRRIDDQLRGRSGRQGDPGSSKFFISLEDDLMKRYKLKELIPEGLYPENQEEPLESTVFAREIARGQRIIEQQNFEIHRTLDKYSIVVEQQRQIIFRLRMNILFDAERSNIMMTRLPEKYTRLCREVGEEVLRQAEKKVLLFLINRCWAEYLDHISYLRETIHLVNLAGKIPASEFNKTAIESFENLKKDIISETAAVLEAAMITSEGIDLEKEGLKAPSSTWTYLVNDRPEQLGMMQMPIALDPLSALLSLPVWIASFSKQKKARRLQ